MPTPKCLFCNTEFQPPNLNSAYCSKAHYRLAKHDRQKMINDLTKNFRKGMYKNVKTLYKFLPEAGQVNIPLLEALKSGFDDAAFYGTYTSNGVEWHKVGSYLFTISEKENIKTLHIFKK